MADLLYQTRRRNHLCVRCGDQDAYTLGGRACCYDCAEKMREYYRNNRDVYLETGKNFYSKRREAGVCTQCGKRPPIAGRIRCEICTAQKRAYSAEKYAEKRAERIAETGIPEDEICVKCLKNRRVENLRVCEDCREQLLRSAKTGAKKSPWRDFKYGKEG